jgi:hypothetical protein
MRIFKLLLVSVVAVAFFSCKPTYEKEYSWSYPVCGDWLVTPSIAGSAISGPFEMRVYNSSKGQDSVWIDDYPVITYNTTTKKYTVTYNFWEMKVKAAVNMTNKTFQTDGSANSIIGYATGVAVDLYPLNIIVTNGKIIGNDSIYLEMEYGDDPGTIYQLAGHRETGYDEYMGNF